MKNVVTFAFMAATLCAITEVASADNGKRAGQSINAKSRKITNAKPFANEDGKPIWFAYPR